jgi:hypothetical protein
MCTKYNIKGKHTHLSSPLLIASLHLTETSRIKSRQRDRKTDRHLSLCQELNHSRVSSALVTLNYCHTFLVLILRHWRGRWGGTRPSQRGLARGVSRSSRDSVAVCVLEVLLVSCVKGFLGLPLVILISKCASRIFWMLLLLLLRVLRCLLA